MSLWITDTNVSPPVHNVSDFRRIEIHTAEPLVLGPSHLEVEITISTLKKYKSPGSDQIPAILIKAGGEALLCVIQVLKRIYELKSKEEVTSWRRNLHNEECNRL
jgi:hypothetical protein